ncbi:hypothetical protein C8R46DRAFT_1044791 [Mycena filopes]|nr:hypothetical protein C8R46DRAFT_1044791 [Mycena filopes]
MVEEERRSTPSQVRDGGGEVGDGVPQGRGAPGRRDIVLYMGSVGRGGEFMGQEDIASLRRRCWRPQLPRKPTGAAVDEAVALDAAVLAAAGDADHAAAAARRRPARLIAAVTFDAAAAAAAAVVASAAVAHRRRSSRIATADHQPHLYSLQVNPALRLRPMPSSTALRYIARQPYKEQIALHLANAGLYVRDRCEGKVYCWIELDKDDHRRAVDGLMTPEELWKLPSLRVKFGSTKNLPHRRRDYNKCNTGGQRRLWLFSFRTTQRYRLERLNQLAFLCEDDRDIQRCSGCKKMHIEIWFLRRVVRSFAELKEQIGALQVAMGESILIIWTATDGSTKNGKWYSKSTKRSHLKEEEQMIASGILPVIQTHNDVGAKPPPVKDKLPTALEVVREEDTMEGDTSPAAARRRLLFLACTLVSWLYIVGGVSRDASNRVLKVLGIIIAMVAVSDTKHKNPAGLTQRTICCPTCYRAYSLEERGSRRTVIMQWRRALEAGTAGKGMGTVWASHTGVRAAVGRRSMLRIQSVAAEGRGGSGRTVIMRWCRALGPGTVSKESNDRAKVVQSAHQIDLLRDPPRIKVVALQERFCTIQRE